MTILKASPLLLLAASLLFSPAARADSFLDCINAVGPDRLDIAETVLDSAADFLDNAECNALYSNPWFDGLCGGIAGGMLAANIARSENACTLLPTQPAGQFLVSVANKVPGPWTGALNGSIQQEQEELASLIPGYACVCKFVGLADDASKIVKETMKLGQDSADCANWVADLFGPAGQAAAQALNQAAQDLQNAYNSAMQTLGNVGCSIMGNCGSNNPPPTQDQYYAKYYAPFEQSYAFADTATQQIVLSAARPACVKFWDFWDAAEDSGFNPAGVLNSAALGEKGPGAATCNAFENRFHANAQKIKDASVAESQKEAQTIGEQFAVDLNILYLGQCKDQQCRTGVYFLSLAVVGEFKQVAQKYGNNMNDPNLQKALQQAKWDIPKKYKPKYQVLLNESSARLAAAVAKDKANVTRQSSLLDAQFSQARGLVARYKLDLKPVVLHLRDPRNPAPVVKRLKTRPIRMTLQE